MGDALAADQPTRPEATFKPRDVEEWIDFHLHRPVAAWFVERVRKTRVTPNQLTAASGFVGLAAGLCVAATYWLPSWMISVSGAVLFWSIILDCMDGQLARVRGTSSIYGRALDGFVDAVAPNAVFFGYVPFLYAQGVSGWLIWLPGWAAGISMIWHANRYDHAKNVYLHNTRPAANLGGAPLVSLEEIERERDEYRARGRRFAAFVLSGFHRYTKNQHAGAKSAIEQQDPITRDEREREIYREIFLPQMRRWSWLGLGTHLAALVAANLLASFSHWIVLANWALFLVPGNLLAWYLIARQPRLIEEYRRRVAEQRQSG